MGLRAEQVLLLDDARSDVGETQVALTRSALQPAECFGLVEVQRRHQQALRAFDDLAILERLPCSPQLRVARGRKRESSGELARVDRLRQVRARAAGDAALDRRRVVAAG